MAKRSDWQDVGEAKALARRPLSQVEAGETSIALSCRRGKFHAISGACNHLGGPLGEGTIEGGYVTCPWHFFKFHAATGLGEPGYEDDCVPAYAVKVEAGRVLVDLASATPRHKTRHAPHTLARPVRRRRGPLRVVGISTTSMTPKRPRYSTSDALLDVALEHAASLGATTQSIRLRSLKFRACEGYYSKSELACQWPCSITQADKTDEMAQVYEAFVHGADVILVATPLRWGAASSLYYRMVERLNSVQNQQVTAGRVLMKDKVAGFIVTGGQDNVQAVAGQMLGFFAELGCQFPAFPYVAHTRGWSAEDMANNVRHVQESEDLRDGARGLVARAMALARVLLASAADERGAAPRERRPASPLVVRRRPLASADAASKSPAKSARPSTSSTEEGRAR